MFPTNLANELNLFAEFICSENLISCFRDGVNELVYFESSSKSLYMLLVHNGINFKEEDEDCDYIDLKKLLTSFEIYKELTLMTQLNNCTINDNYMCMC